MFAEAAATTTSGKTAGSTMSSDAGCTSLFVLYADTEVTEANLTGGVATGAEDAAAMAASGDAQATGDVRVCAVRSAAPVASWIAVTVMVSAFTNAAASVIVEITASVVVSAVPKADADCVAPANARAAAAHATTPAPWVVAGSTTSARFEHAASFAAAGTTALLTDVLGYASAAVAARSALAATAAIAAASPAFQAFEAATTIPIATNLARSADAA